MNRILPVLACLIVLVVAGCATPDYAGPAKRYIEQFDAQNLHTKHLVVRPDGRKLAVRQFGAEHRSAGPSIVLMHGFPDSQHLYDRVVPILARSRHVITFDFLGWGDSEKPAAHNYDIASLRTDFETVLSAFNIDNPVVVVHDLSGQPGIDWALDNEKRVAALVLLNTYYLPMKSIKAPEAIARFSTPGLWRDMSVWGASRVDAMWQSGVDEQLRKFFSDNGAKETYVNLFVHQALGIRPAFFGENAILLDEIAKRSGTRDRLARFSMPVRIVFGADDPYLNVEVAKEFKDLFPAAELSLIKGGAHYVQLDKPAEVATKILSAGNPGK